MKTQNFKKLNRKEQKHIKGSGPIRKCSSSIQCNPGECCTGGFCMPSPVIECEPMIPD